MSPPATPIDEQRRALIIFARAPRLGEVKTRLAADLGSEKALEIYRWLAERVIAAVQRSPGWSVSVAFTPTDAESVMRDWLGDSIPTRPPGADDS